MAGLLRSFRPRHRVALLVTVLALLLLQLLRLPPASAALGAATSSTSAFRGSIVVTDADTLAAALTPGAQLVLHGGTYELPASLSLPAGASLRAHPGHKVALQLAPSAPHPVLSIVDADGASVSGVHVLGHTSLQRTMAVEVVGGDNLTLDSLTVRGGLRVSGGTRHTVTRSDISNAHGAAGGTCVWYHNAGDAMSLARSNHVISHSEVHDCRGQGVEWPSASWPCVPTKLKPGQHCYPDPDPNATGSGIYLVQTIGVNVTQNYVHDVNYHGVHLEARLSAASKHSWPGTGAQTPSALNTIELNKIQDWMQCTPTNTSKGPAGCRTGADGGCVYFFTYIWSHGQRVTHNLCHQSRPDLWPVGKVLYLDGTSSGIETLGNIGWNVTGNVIDNNDGHDNHHFGNIGIDGSHMGSLTDSNFWGSKGDYDFGGGYHCTNHYGNNSEHSSANGGLNTTESMALVGSYFDSPTWRAAFPEIQTWWNKTVWVGPAGPTPCDPYDQGMDCCMFPTGTSANYSIMVNVPGGANGWGGRCAHNESKNCGWQNISAEFCGDTKPGHPGPGHAFDDPIGCWPDRARFQVVGRQKLYTSDPGFIDMAAGNFALQLDAEIFSDFPGFPQIPFAQIGPQVGTPGAPHSTY